jgi:ribonuclease HI
LQVVLATDASLKYIRAALLQHYMFGNRSVLYPAGYYSNELDETQTWYASQECELLAIVLALRHCRHWVERGDVIVVTDHESLKGFNTKAE